MNKKYSKSNKGFTLIEMLVATALFTVVVTIAMGSIVTIIDANRKAQSLTILMNDLNFALDSITRSAKTTSPDQFSSNSQFELNLGLGGDIYKIEIDDDSGYYTLEKNGTPMISDQIQLDSDVSGFQIFNEYDGQPRVLITLKGTAQISPKIGSDFIIQTTVSPRKLDIQYD